MNREEKKIKCVVGRRSVRREAMVSIRVMREEELRGERHGWVWVVVGALRT